MPDTELLTDQQIAEIAFAQAERLKSAEAFGVPVPPFWHDIDALIATVKQLRDERDTARSDLEERTTEREMWRGRYDEELKEHSETQSQLEQLRAENERLRECLMPFTNKGQLFIFHRNVEHGDYFECLFCRREGKQWKEIPHDQMLCPIASAQMALKIVELEKLT